MAVLKTKLCEILGVRYPIISAGMGRAARVELVAEVCNAGGFGVLGAVSRTPDQIRDDVRRVRELTDKPFAVDLLVPARMRAPDEEREPPLDPPPFLDEFRRELGIRLWEERRQELLERRERGKTFEEVQRQVEVILEEKVPFFASALGSPDWVVEKFHAQGTKVISLVGNVRQARKVAEAGADIVVAQGYDAGGHTGRVGTFSLIPQVVDAVKPLPVVAAGGIGDGRGLVAALALGACGVWVGTRFLATHEAGEIEAYKRKILEASEEDTDRTASWTGFTQRTLKNRFTQAWEPSGVKPYRAPLQQVVVGDVEQAARAQERTDLMRIPMGQIAGMVTSLKSARQVVEDMVEEALQALEQGLGPSSGLEYSR